MANNLRKHKRFSATAFLNTPIRLQPLPPYFGSIIDGTLIDLSAGGMALIMDELIPQGNRLALTLRFPDHSELQTTVQVVHTSPRSGRFFHGFEFLSIPTYMSEKIDHMSQDYVDCENRIAQKEKEVCKPNCAFFTMCSKKERREPLFNVDVALELAFKTLEDSPLTS